jgi:hypothetical protein
MLSKIVTQRPDAEGKLVPCETWDNATLCCEVKSDNQSFPMYLQTYRIAPGETNTWYIRVLGTQMSVEYSTKYPKTLRTLNYAPGGEQAWNVCSIWAYETALPDHFRWNLRVRLFRRAAANVGRLLRSTGARTRRHEAAALLRHT